MPHFYQDVYKAINYVLIRACLYLLTVANTGMVTEWLAQSFYAVVSDILCFLTTFYQIEIELYQCLVCRIKKHWRSLSSDIYQSSLSTNDTVNNTF